MKKLTAALLLLCLTLCCFSAAGAETYTVIPLPKTVGNAALSHASEEMDWFAYQDAEQKDLYEYLHLCNCYGSYPYLYYDEKYPDLQEYLLITPGAELSVLVVYDPDQKVLSVECMKKAQFAFHEETEKRRSLVKEEITLPSSISARYVLPQFYQVLSINKGGMHQPSRQGRISGLSYVFDEKECWYEFYEDVDPIYLMLYTMYVYPFYFDVEVDWFSVADDNTIDAMILHYYNDEAEVIVSYDAARNEATVYYKPGISYYLLNAQEMSQIFKK